VELASTGREGIDRVAGAGEPFDAVLMDIQMPDMDGITALKAIREQEPLRSIPVIAITSYAMKGDRERLLSKGFVDYISKPIDNEVFLTSIKYTLERHYG
jgi:CheY-like chemotaxis protein